MMSGVKVWNHDISTSDRIVEVRNNAYGILKERQIIWLRFAKGLYFMEEYKE